MIGLLILASMLALGGCSPGPQGPVAAADFYEGKTIDFVVSDNPGGETDLLARVMASYLERNSGANVVVTNRRGAGGLDGMNYLYSRDADGLALGVVSASKFVTNDVLDEPAAVYDIEDFSYIMALGHEPICFFVSPDGPYQSIGDLQSGKDLKIGGGSPSGPISLGGVTVAEILNLDAKVVTGLGSETERSLAVERGEIVGYTNTLPTVRAALESGLLKPLFVLGTQRDPLAPDVPAITELVSLTGEDLALVKLWETALVGGKRIYLAPPGMPQDRQAFLRDMAEGWAQDTQFHEEIDRVTGYEVREYIVGDAVSDVMMDLAAGLDEYRAKFAEMIEKYRA
jgi:tripartite-type tricarboxylate transporter receptor subunit TctC